MWWFLTALLEQLGMTARKAMETEKPPAPTVAGVTEAEGEAEEAEEAKFGPR
jgi:hypothetical protein